MENNILSILETEKPRNLFINKSRYNYGNNLKNLDKKLFILVCKNFFVDTENIINNRVKTIKYWFLHNLSLILLDEINTKKFDLIKDINYEYICEDISIVYDYFKTVYFGEESQVNKFIFLPSMTLFSNWCNVSNVDKIIIHHKIIKELCYLDDNYFFLINYLRMHSKKFLMHVMKNKYEMDKGNNMIIHLFRSANMKNDNCSYKNFNKIINYIFTEIYDNKFMEILMEKNSNQKRAINLIVFLRQNFYNVIIDNIVREITLKEFMDKYFSNIVKNITHKYQIENIFLKYDAMDKLLSYGPKFEHLYQKLLRNKLMMFNEKYQIIEFMRSNNLILIDEKDRELLGRKMWEKLHEKIS